MGNSTIVRENDTYTVTTGELRTCFSGLSAAAEQIALLHSLIERLQSALPGCAKRRAERAEQGLRNLENTAMEERRKLIAERDALKAKLAEAENPRGTRAKP